MDDYEGEEEDEISFPEGAVVDVLQKRLDGWWVVRYEDQTGLAPGTFLRKVQTDLVNVPSLSDTVTDSTCTQSLSLPPSLPHTHTHHSQSYQRIKSQTHFQLPITKEGRPMRTSNYRWRELSHLDGNKIKDNNSPFFSVHAHTSCHV